MAHDCSPNYSSGRNQEDNDSKPRGAVCKTLCQKYLTQNRACGVAQVVECLPSRYESLSSNPSIVTKKKKRKEVILKFKSRREKIYVKITMHILLFHSIYTSF
jgi:hypothetical protein